MITEETKHCDQLGARPLEVEEPIILAPRSANLGILHGFLEVCLHQGVRIWRHLPSSLRVSSLGRAYGRRLHALVLTQSERRQSFGTFFLRNRPEMELMKRLLSQKAPGSKLDISVLACSKGAEVYSVQWAIRSARPDLRLNMHALDISQEILEFAERGIYSRTAPDDSMPSPKSGSKEIADVSWNTSRDQNAPIFERMTDEEVKAMFEVDGDQAKVRPWLKEGIKWLRGDANDPELLRCSGPSGDCGGKSVSLSYGALGCGKVFAQRCATGEAGRIPICHRHRLGCPCEGRA